MHRRNKIPKVKSSLQEIGLFVHIALCFSPPGWQRDKRAHEQRKGIEILLNQFGQQQQSRFMRV